MCGLKERTHRESGMRRGRGWMQNASDQMQGWPSEAWPHTAKPPSRVPEFQRRTGFASKVVWRTRGSSEAQRRRVSMFVLLQLEGLAHTEGHDDITGIDRCLQRPDAAGSESGVQRTPRFAAQPSRCERVAQRAAAVFACQPLCIDHSIVKHY